MSTETLDLPPIDAAAPVSSAGAAVAALQPDLAKLDLQTVALAQFNGSHAAAKAARETLAGVEHDLSTPTKLADAKSLRNRLINVPLADARKVSAGLKSKLTAVSRAVGAELTAIETAFEGVEQLITPQIDAAQTKLDEERRLAAEKEAARVEAHKVNLAKLAGYVEHARGLPAARIADGITKVEGIVIDREAWEDFADQAEEQKAVTLERMRALLATAQADEERERIAAAQKAEADRLAAIAADLERQRAELQAQQEAAAQAQREREEAERVELEAQRQAQAITTRIASEAAKAAAPGFVARKALPDGVIAGAVVNDSGNWYAADGTFMNPDGSRSIFDDVDEESEIEFAPQAATNTHEQGSQQVLKAEAPAPDATDRGAPVTQSPVCGPMGAGQAAAAAPAPEVRAFHPAAAALRNELPTMTLGQLGTRLGFNPTADFLASLGFEAHKERASRLYPPSDFPAICLAISAHLIALAGQQRQAA